MAQFKPDFAPTDFDWTLQWKNNLSKLITSLKSFLPNPTFTTVEIDEDAILHGNILGEGALEIEEDLSAEDAAFSGEVAVGQDLYVGEDLAVSGEARAESLTIGGIQFHPPVVDSPVATTSGTSVSISTTIPSWVRKIILTFEAVSTNGTSPPIIQIGPSGGLATSGYSGSVTYTLDAAATDGAANNNGFRIANQWAAAATLKGTAILSLHDATNNIWVCSSLCARDNSSSWQGAGSVTLSGALTRVSLTTSTGVDTFDNGSVTLRYES